MRTYLLFIFLFFPFLILSQNQIVDFKLEKTKDGIKISPDVDVLFEGTKNYLRIEVIGNLEIYDTSAFGEISTEKGFLVLDVNSKVNPFETLRIYTKEKSSGAKSVFEKKFRIIPIPTVHISGVENDSALERNLILLAGKLDLKSILPSLNLEVDSFKLEIIQNGIINNFASQSGSFTRDMRSSIWGIQEGTSILFYDIYTSYTGGSPISLTPIRIYTFYDRTRPTKLSTGSGVIIRQ